MAITNYYFLVLDIETSKEMGYSEKLKKELPIKTWLAYGVCELYDITGKLHSKLRFREWSQLIEFLKHWSDRFRNKDLLCYVHNLGFEFDFLMKNIARPKKFICNNSHSVIMGKLEGLKIDFRCSYQLSKLSIAKIGQMYNFPKGHSDYRNIYPDDEITEEEWKYCERDCDIIVPYIIDELKNYKMLSNIPYTSTGRVRKELSNLINNEEIPDWDFMPPEDCYEALVKSFRGGLTMSNPRYTNKILNCKIRSFDEKSKYPSVMLTEEFPYTIRKENNFDNNTYKKYKFWIAKVRLNNIYSKYDWGYISTATNTYTDFVFSDIFNGKIINCKCCELYITNIDFKTINLVYNISSIEFLEFYPCEKYSLLPSHFFNLICEFAEPKCELGKQLKQIAEEFGEDSPEWRECNKAYMESKAKLNGIYGMMVQKLIQSDYTIDENYNWTEVKKAYKYTPNKHMKRNFLYGIFITSYSRYDLVKNIVHNCPWNFVYCDTDSIKFIDIGVPFDDINSPINEAVVNIPYLKDFNRFEEEPSYSAFITYGAKKYAYIREGKFGFVVAGLPKKVPIHSFEDFTLGTTYKNCKLAKRYIYHKSILDIDIYSGEVINTEELSEDYGNGGVALFEVDYKLEMTNEDLYYIESRLDIWQKRNIQQNIFCQS